MISKKDILCVVDFTNVDETDDNGFFEEHGTGFISTQKLVKELIVIEVLMRNENPYNMEIAWTKLNEIIDTIKGKK